MRTTRLYQQLAQLERAALAALKECHTLSDLRKWRKEYIG